MAAAVRSAGQAPSVKVSAAGSATTVPKTEPVKRHSRNIRLSTANTVGKTMTATVARAPNLSAWNRSCAMNQVAVPSARA